jgi:hypothetical protein
MGIPEIRIQLAAARDQLRHAKDIHEMVRAETEQHTIDQAGGSIGKNEAERTRALVLALNRDPRYRGALTQIRICEAEVDRLEALLEGARDARRVEEWAIRARLADALLYAGVQSDHTDRTGDAAFDDGIDHLTLETLPF